jgi:hypothetical protein
VDVVRSTEVAPLVDAMRLPEDWSIAVHRLRSFRYRDKVRLVAYEGAIPKHGWEGYDVPGGLAYLERRIEGGSTTGYVVTTDAEGWVRSIEEGV